MPERAPIAVFTWDNDLATSNDAALANYVEHKVNHLGLLPFGKGKTALADAVLNAVEEGALVLPAHLVVDRKLPMTDHLLEVLLPLATEVVDRVM